MPAQRFGIQGLQPAVSPELVVPGVLSLPYGGPTGVGGPYAQGQALGCVQVAAQSEVVTLSFTGAATGGTFTVVVTLDKSYVLSNLAYNITLANFQAALVAAIPEFSGNVTVTGTASVSGTGGTYTITFNNQLANQRIGGLFAVTPALTGGSSPTGSFARTTRGSCGLAQADVYDQSTNNRLDAFLRYDTLLTPGGALVPFGFAGSVAASGQPFQPEVYLEGIFNKDDVVGVDANALTLGKLTKWKGGVMYRLI